MYKNDIGCYIQIYKNNGYPEFALGHFRKHYPDSSLYIVSDNGYNFKDLAKNLNAEYEHSKINVGVSSSGYFLKEINEWLSRMERCFKYCNSEFVIYLEDDIFLRSKIKSDINGKINGYKGNKIPEEILSYFYNKYNPKKFNSMNYGACGGTIYHRETFLNSLGFFKEVIKNDFSYVRDNVSKIFGFFDCSMTVLYMLAGHEYSINSDLIGTVNFPDWRSLNNAIVHAQKKSSDDNIQSVIMKEFPI